MPALKIPSQETIALLSDGLLRGVRTYFAENNFCEIAVPSLTGGAGSCENPHSLFQLDYFGKRAFLCQTGQLYLETMLSSIPRVATVCQSFRAEKIADSRHLTQFTLVEFEHRGTFDELLSHINGIFSSMMRAASNVLMQEITWQTPPIITYRQAVEDLRHVIPYNFTHQDELSLVQNYGNGSCPVLVTDFLHQLKFFNMKRVGEHGEFVKSLDLILPYSGEAVGGAERECDPVILKKELCNSGMFQLLQQQGITLNDFDFYLSRVPTFPHAGCGIGLERVMQSILGIDDIRKVALFPMNSVTLY